MPNQNIIQSCHKLISAYKSGLLGQTVMPEEASPKFSDKEKEIRIAYFTLPMALNYQRDSYKLWEAALKTFEDGETRDVFDIEKASKMGEEELRKKLLKYKLALQPNKHIHTWSTISKTVYENWGNLSKLFDSCDHDFLKLRETVQKEFKKGFPYISGAKIFNYWSYILGEYAGLKLKNTEYIEAATDTHLTQSSVKLGVITAEEAKTLTKEQLAARWRKILDGSGITPTEMNNPLWFWSRNKFIYKLD